jgi:hypothetical protein
LRVDRETGDGQAWACEGCVTETRGDAERERVGGRARAT